MSDKIPEIMGTEFSEWFRRTRRVLDVTQKQFSAAWGRTQSAVSDIERGDRIEYSAEDVAGIVSALLACAAEADPAQIEQEAYLAAGLLPPSARRSPVAQKVPAPLVRDLDPDRDAYIAFYDNAPDEEARRRLKIIGEQFAAQWHKEKHADGAKGED